MMSIPRAVYELLVLVLSIHFVGAFIAPNPVQRELLPDALKATSSPTFENLGQQRKDSEESVLGLTENQALTYKKTGSYCLDLFTDVLPHIRKDELCSYLETAWSEDPLITLKLIFQMGDPRKGKSDRVNFHQSLLWLYHHHYETLMLNLHRVGEFAYYKSMLELLVLAIDGSDALDDNRVKNRNRGSQGRLTEEAYSRRTQTRHETHQRNVEEFMNTLPESMASEWKESSPNIKTTNGRGFTWVNDDMRNHFVKFVEERNKELSKKARAAKKER